MIFSLGTVFLLGLISAFIIQKIHIPKLVGMLLTGILCGPYVLNILDSALLGISAELRKIALIIILIKAGLSLRFCDLKKIGRPSSADVISAGVF